MSLKLNNNDTGSGWIDVSVPLREDMAVFANEQKLRIEHRASMERGDGSNNTRTPAAASNAGFRAVAQSRGRQCGG